MGRGNRGPAWAESGGAADAQLLQRVAQALSPTGSSSPSPAKLLSETRLQSLWAGYGSISAAKLQVGTGSRAMTVQLILKRVEAQSGSGVSHQRKLRSYNNEAVFYRDLAPKLLRQGIAMPQPLLVESEGPGKLLLVMKDQREEFPLYARTLSLAEAKAALSWLAAFHAFFWGQPCPAGLWEQGTFWHLDTRREEFENIGWPALAGAADAVDLYLKAKGAGADNAEHMTVVHGDFKQENLLFSSDGQRCAAHDFQYCGRGLGAKDIAYLFCAGLSSQLLPAHEEELLQHYHTELMARLAPAGLGRGYTLQTLQLHLNLALVDFVRFMDGWGYWGNNRWATQKVEAAMKEHAGLLGI